MEDIDAAFYHGISRDSALSSSKNSLARKPPGTDEWFTSENVYAEGSATASSSTVTLSGLLSAIDGVAAQEGRLLFATTNNYSALDPALVRPGRLDVHIRFNNAERAQVEELFQRFFLPSYASGQILEETVRSDEEYEAIDEGYETGSRKQVYRLAREFASRVPEKEFSMAAIQGLLMQYKTRPRGAIEEVDSWIESERRRRAEQGEKDITAHWRIDEKIIDGPYPHYPELPHSTSEGRFGAPVGLWWLLGIMIICIIC